MPITPLPTAPSRYDPAKFTVRAEAFFAALSAMVTELNNQAAATVVGNSYTSGNAGVGAAPSSWGTSFRAVDMRTYGSFFDANAGYSGVGSNLYNDGGSWRFKTNNAGVLYLQLVSNGNHEWYSVAPGTAGAVATLPKIMSLDVNGNWSIAGYQASMGRTSGGVADQTLYRDQTNYYTFDYYRNNGTVYASQQTGQILGVAWNIASGLSYYWQINAASALTLDASGLLWKAAFGGIGYGVGAGCTYAQATSKATTVTINPAKPSGIITMNAAALAAGASVSFNISNTLFGDYDVVHVNPAVTAVDPRASYRIEVAASGAGFATIRVTNISAGSLSEAVAMKFALIKGANA
jgi:hypothetical protein